MHEAVARRGAAGGGRGWGRGWRRWLVGPLARSCSKIDSAPLRTLKRVDAPPPPPPPWQRLTIAAAVCPPWVLTPAYWRSRSRCPPRAVLRRPNAKISTTTATGGREAGSATPTLVRGLHHLQPAVATRWCFHRCTCAVGARPYASYARPSVLFGTCVLCRYMRVLLASAGKRTASGTSGGEGARGEVRGGASRGRGP